MPYHVKLTGTDHQIKRDAGRRVWSSDPRLSTRLIQHFGSSYCYNDKFIIYPSHVIEKIWNKYLRSTVQGLFTKEKHISKRTMVNFSMRTIFWVKNHYKCIKKMCFCWVRKRSEKTPWYHVCRISCRSSFL